MVKPLDTATLGPVRVAPLSHREADAKLVREALEAAAQAEPDWKVQRAIMTVAGYGHTETLAYIRRLLKG